MNVCACVGLVSLVVGHPFDTIRVQLQTQRFSGEYKGLITCLKMVNAYSLNRGLFRGLSLPFLSYGVSNAMYFGSYFSMVKWLRTEYADKLSEDSAILLSGCFAGVAGQLLDVPVEVVKTVMQSQINRPVRVYFSSPFACAAHIVQKQGVRGLFRGFLLQTARDVPSSAAYFYIYEALFRRLYGPRYVAHEELSTAPRYTVSKHNVLPPDDELLTNTSFKLRWPSFMNDHARLLATSMLAGGLAGTLSWLPIMPIDVIKSRVQSDAERVRYKNAFDCIVKTYKAEGVRAFFHGTAVSMMQAFPISAVQFVTYELAIRWLSSAGESRKSKC